MATTVRTNESELPQEISGFPSAIELFTCGTVEVTWIRRSYKCRYGHELWDRPTTGFLKMDWEISAETLSYERYRSFKR